MVIRRGHVDSLMLVQLSIHNIVLIEMLDIHFTAGLTVLTGETGAGKSILLDALSLALGDREMLRLCVMVLIAGRLRLF